MNRHQQLVEKAERALAKAQQHAALPHEGAKLKLAQKNLARAEATLAKLNGSMLATTDSYKLNHPEN